MARIAIDGNFEGGPKVFGGAVNQLKELNSDIVIVGKKEDYRFMVRDGIDFVPTQQYFDSSRSRSRVLAAAKDLEVSTTKAFNMLLSGEVDAMVTCYDTRLLGFLMILGEKQGQLESILEDSKPSLAQLFPSVRSNQNEAAWLDIGMNIEASPENYATWGRMGAALFSVLKGVYKPKVGLLSIADEDNKQPAELLKAAKLLAANPFAYDFVGFSEPKDAFLGGKIDSPDVVVANGFTGNIGLKTAEAVIAAAKSMYSELNGFQEGALKLGLGLSGLANRLRLFNAKEKNGAYVLGMDLTNPDRTLNILKGHGNTDSDGLYHAVLRAQSTVFNNTIKHVNELLRGDEKLMDPDPAA